MGLYRHDITCGNYVRAIPAQRYTEHHWTISNQMDERSNFAKACENHQRRPKARGNNSKQKCCNLRGSEELTNYIIHRTTRPHSEWVEGTIWILNVWASKGCQVSKNDNFGRLPPPSSPHVRNRTARPPSATGANLYRNPMVVLSPKAPCSW